MLQERPNTPTNTEGNEVINKGSQQGYLVSDGTNNRVLIGFQKDGFGDGKDYGIKVSQEGFDVNSASEDELVMSSGFNMFKIVASGSIPVPELADAPAGSFRTQSVTYDTGLSYTDVPAVLFFAAGTSGGVGFNTTPRGILPAITHQLDADAIPTGGSILTITRGTSYISGGTLQLSISQTNYDTSLPIAATNIKWYVLAETILNA